MLLLGPAFLCSTPSVKIPAFSLPARTKQYCSVILALAVLAAFAHPLTRPPSPVIAPAPAHVRARLFNAGIWTVHFGIDNPGRDSQRRMRDLIRDMELDVVGLLETDLHVRLIHNRLGCTRC